MKASDIITRNNYSNLDFVEKTLDILYKNIEFHSDLGQNQTSVYISFLLENELEELIEKLIQDGFKTKIIGDNESLLVEWELQNKPCCM